MLGLGHEGVEYVYHKKDVPNLWWLRPDTSE